MFEFVHVREPLFVNIHTAIYYRGDRDRLGWDLRFVSALLLRVAAQIIFGWCGNGVVSLI